MNTHKQWLAPLAVAAFLVGAPAALVQPLSGDLSAKTVARVQPVKLAAMEAHFETSRRAPLLIGGLPDVEFDKGKLGTAGYALMLEQDLEKVKKFLREKNDAGLLNLNKLCVVGSDERFCARFSGSPPAPPSPRPTQSMPSGPKARCPPLWFAYGCGTVRSCWRLPCRARPARARKRSITVAPEPCAV